MLTMSQNSSPDISLIEKILIKTELMKIDDNKSEKSVKNFKTSPNSSSTKLDQNGSKTKRRSSRRTKKPVKRLESATILRNGKKNRSRKSNNPIKLEQTKHLESVIVNIVKKFKECK
ncbi:hypothetical protein ACKWTF_015576 [Chironomus riparius]